MIRIYRIAFSPLEMIATFEDHHWVKYEDQIYKEHDLPTETE